MDNFGPAVSTFIFVRLSKVFDQIFQTFEDLWESDPGPSHASSAFCLQRFKETTSASFIYISCLIVLHKGKQVINFYFCKRSILTCWIYGRWTDICGWLWLIWTLPPELLRRWTHHPCVPLQALPPEENKQQKYIGRNHTFQASLMTLEFCEFNIFSG